MENVYGVLYGTSCLNETNQNSTELYVCLFSWRFRSTVFSTYLSNEGMAGNICNLFIKVRFLAEIVSDQSLIPTHLLELFSQLHCAEGEKGILQAIPHLSPSSDTSREPRNSSVPCEAPRTCQALVPLSPRPGESTSRAPNRGCRLAEPRGAEAPLRSHPAPRAGKPRASARPPR